MTLPAPGLFGRPAAILVCSLLLVLVLHSAPAAARPFRGSVEWSVLLCRHAADADAQGNPPRDRAFYENLFYKDGTNGLADYMDQVSYGNLNLDGSIVMGWYTMPFTLNQSRTRNRRQIWDDCINAAAAGGYNLPDGRLAAVVTWPSRDLYGWPGRGAYMPWNAEIGAYAHEVGHGFGFEHSYSNDPTYRNADWAQIGEYHDPWDVMSYAAVYSTDTGTDGHGRWGPGLNAYHKDRMGWMPTDKIYRFGAKGETSATIWLEPLTTYDYRTFYLEWINTIDWGKLAGLGRRGLRHGFEESSYKKTSYSKTTTPTLTSTTSKTPTTTTATNLDWSKLGSTIREGSLGDFDSDSLVLDPKSPNFDFTSALGKDWNPTIATRLSPEDFKLDLPSLPLLDIDWSKIFPLPPTYLMIRIPFDSTDPFHYYTVEYRRNSGLDAGIPADHQVLIHEVKAHKDKEGRDDGYRSFLIRNLTSHGKPPSTWLNANGVSITTLSVGDHAAQILVQQACKEPFVYRRACNNDYVCVTEEARARTEDENLLHSSRVNPACSNGGCYYGRDTCLQGFVWREACPGTEYDEDGESRPRDRVCVPIESRTTAAQDNALHNGRDVDFAQWGVANYGPNVCKQGYVWRAADNHDYVCVRGWVRTQTAEENEAHAQRRDPACANGGCQYGVEQCLQGWVWRDAFPGDKICTTRDSRAQAAVDNAAAESRLQNKDA